MRSDGKIYALMATGRIANVPSVVSNLGVGVLLGFAGSGGEFQWPWLLMVAGVCFYVGGNFLNDYTDREWDAEKRPERALPRGLFSPPLYLWTAGLLGVVGLGLAILYGLEAVLVSSFLVGVIVWYTLIHKRTGFSVLPMGLCRASLPVLGFVAMRGGFQGVVFFPAGALLLYIVALSLSARWESRGDIPEEKKWQARGLLVGAGVLAALLPMLMSPVSGWVGFLPFLLWLLLCLTKYRAPVPAHVSALLAGIPLVDWVVLFPVALVWLRLQRVDTGDPMFLCALLMAPVCFVLGRVLQLVSPAT
ncbi:MAG: UbiA family prenyltransferase [Luteolibacter sp.]